VSSHNGPVDVITFVRWAESDPTEIRNIKPNMIVQNVVLAILFIFFDLLFFLLPFAHKFVNRRITPSFKVNFRSIASSQVRVRWMLSNR
jgi:hypothetical protein